MDRNSKLDLKGVLAAAEEARSRIEALPEHEQQAVLLVSRQAASEKSREVLAATDPYPPDPTTREEALQTLAAFAKTAPGRLPTRVEAALRIATEQDPRRVVEQFADLLSLNRNGERAEMIVIKYQRQPPSLLHHVQADTVEQAYQAAANWCQAQVSQA